MAEIDKNRKPTKLLWVDLEMTGLDAQEHVIVEVAAQVTDFGFNVQDEFEAVIWQSDEVLAQSNPWAAQQHAKSGLLERIRTDGRPESDVSREFAAFIVKNFGDEPAVLAGNSIHSDRGFIKRWWPEVNELLHYRMLDVSSFKVVMQGVYAVEYPKPEIHRAMNDIQASIAELEYYLGWLRQGGRRLVDHRTVEDYLLSMPNAALDYPFGEGVAVYKVADKMFALIAEGSQPLRLSLKCDPQLSVTLRERYETVLPGYHLNKKHWNTLILSGQLAWEDVQDLIRLSYDLVADRT